MKALLKISFVLATLLLALPVCQVMSTEKGRPYWWDRLEVLAKRDGYQLMRPAELKQLYDRGESMAIIDARTVHEFRAGHLPGARNVEFHLGHASRLDAAKEKELREALGPELKRRVVVYDRGLQCTRSQLASQWAVSLGYENVWHLAEGWLGWLALTHQGSRGETEHKAAAGDKFPNLRLTILDGKSDRVYLGVAPNAVTLELGAMKSEYALVELYNELCFACCQSVPELNRLLGLIEKDPALAGRLKLIGIGVGNLNREVHRFRLERKVGFPLFSDQDRSLHKLLGEPDLPALYLVRLRGPTGPRILSLQTGPFESAAELFQRIRLSINMAP